MSATSPLEIQAETARLEALERFCIMDTPPEPAFDRVTRLVCAIFRTPMANITLIDAHRQWFKSRIGMDDSETDRQRVGRISESVIRRAKSVGAIRFAIAPYILLFVIGGHSRSKNDVASLAYDPVIHLRNRQEKMDARIKSGHDD